MPVKWTAELDQQLLLLILKLVSVNTKTIADGWAEHYGTENAPTSRAISEHLAVLKKKVGTAGIPSGAISTTATPAKSTCNPSTPLSKPTPKPGSNLSKPSGSAKRKFSTMNEVEYDEEPDFNEVLPPRSSLSRKSKTDAQRTRLESDDEGNITVKTESMNGTFADFLNDAGSIVGESKPKKPASRNGKFAKQLVDLAIDDDSDVSEYSPWN